MRINKTLKTMRDQERFFIIMIIHNQKQDIFKNKNWFASEPVKYARDGSPFQTVLARAAGAAGFTSAISTCVFSSSTTTINGAS